MNAEQTDSVCRRALIFVEDSLTIGPTQYAKQLTNAEVADPGR